MGEVPNRRKSSSQSHSPRRPKVVLGTPRGASADPLDFYIIDWPIMLYVIILSITPTPSSAPVLNATGEMA